MANWEPQDRDPYYLVGRCNPYLDEPEPVRFSRGTYVGAFFICVCCLTVAALLLWGQQ